MEEVSFTQKSTPKLPEGAKILSKDVRISCEEIENGFILRKSYDIKYMLGDVTTYAYFCKTWYSKDNPITIKDMSEKTLADKLD